MRITAFLIGILIILPSALSAQATYQAVNSATGTGTSVTISSFSVAAGNSLYCVVGQYSGTVSGTPTFDSDNVSVEASSTATGASSTSTFFIHSSAMTGDRTGTFNATLSTSVDWTANCFHYSGVASGTSLRTAVTDDSVASGEKQSDTNTVSTSANGDTCLAFVNAGNEDGDNPATSMAPAGSETERLDSNWSSGRTLGVYELAATGANTIIGGDWSGGSSGNGPYTHVSNCLIPASGIAPLAIQLLSE